MDITQTSEKEEIKNEVDESPLVVDESPPEVDKSTPETDESAPEVSESSSEVDKSAPETDESFPAQPIEKKFMYACLVLVGLFVISLLVSLGSESSPFRNMDNASHSLVIPPEQPKGEVAGAQTVGPQAPPAESEKSTVSEKPAPTAVPEATTGPTVAPTATPAPTSPPSSNPTATPSTGSGPTATPEPTAAPTDTPTPTPTEPA